MRLSTSFVAIALFVAPAAYASDDATLISDARAVVQTFKKKDANVEKFFSSSVQLGGQTYSEIIFFENASTLSEFKKGNFALAAQASAVALSAGAAAAANYENGVAIFTATKTGLMYEASVGGQKFGFHPFGTQKK